MCWGGDFIKISIFWAPPPGAHEKHPTDETLCVSSVRNFLGYKPVGVLYKKHLYAERPLGISTL